MRSIGKLAVRRRVGGYARDEDGATAIEYGLIAALIAISLIGALTALSDTMSDNFSKVAEIGG